MDGLMWIAQLALAATFLFNGTFKLFAFRPWVASLQRHGQQPVVLAPFQAKLIGLTEVALALGVLIPDVFTPDGVVPEYLIIRLSAAGLALLMIGAAIYHTRRKESAAFVVSVFLLALFVIVGRWP